MNLIDSNRKYNKYHVNDKVNREFGVCEGRGWEITDEIVHTCFMENIRNVYRDSVIRSLNFELW